MDDELSAVIREQQMVVAALQASTKLLVERVKSLPFRSKPASTPILLLGITERLIEAHRTARIDGDGLTLDLIEDALRHVGERLAKEHGDGRDFSRKRLRPLE